MISRSSYALAVGVALAALGAAGSASAAYVIDLSTNPLNTPANIQGPGAPSAATRFAYAPGTLTAHVDSSQPTIKLLWPLGKTLTQNDNFTFAFPLTIAPGFHAAEDQYAQFSVGLMNSLTTGSNRSGTPASLAGDTFDVVSLDYFPNHSSFGWSSLTPTYITSSTGPGDADALAFDPAHQHLFYTYGPETDLGDEGDLPLGALITLQGSYDGATRTLTARVLQGSGALDINAVGDGNLPGGFDGDPTTIQSVLPAGQSFSVDSLAIALWNDGWTTAGDPSIVGDVIFSTPVPEPATLALLLPAALVLTLRRRATSRGA